MTAPLTPSDCDLRGLPFMPMDVVRLLDSDLFALATGDEFKAALALWCKAWLQVPAASLPDDDRVLAHLSGAGSRWKKLKAMALKGWIACNDGRLYHPVVAEKANDAWERRGEWQEKQNNKNERQQRWRDHLKAVSAELRGLGVTPPSNASLKELESLLVDAKASTSASTGASTVDAGEAAKTGTGTGTITPKSPSLPNDLQAVMEAAGLASPPDNRVLKAWYALGADLDQDIIPTLKRVSAREKERSGKPPFSLKFFDTAIREKLAADQSEIERLRRIGERNDLSRQPASSD